MATNPEDQPEQTAPQPAPSNDMQRALDAKARAINAIQRASAATVRIEELKSRLMVAPEGEGVAAGQHRAAGLALINHQLNLANKNHDRAMRWERKARNRFDHFASYDDYESLVKVIRYAHVVEKKAHLCERQAQWAEHYTIDRNRAEITDTEEGEDKG